MPVQTTYPGVYIQEVPSGSHAIAGVSTSVTAFVGAARMGPAGVPVAIQSMAEYVRNFGPPWDAAHPMGHAVSHFFANGGSQAIIVRVSAQGAATATATLTGGPLTLTALGPGSWATRSAAPGTAGLEASVEANAANGSLFNLTLTLRAPDPRTGAVGVVAQESYPNLSLDPSSPRYAYNTLVGSFLIAKPAPPAMGSPPGSPPSMPGSPPAAPVPTPGVVGFAGGLDGADGTANAGAVGAADVIPLDTTKGGIYALGVLLFPRFNLLCLPDVPATATSSSFLTTALGFCALQRAFLIVDTPPSPPGATLDLTTISGLASEHGAVYYPRVVQLDPGPGGLVRQLDLPPCGAVAGVMARTDAARGLWKAPAGLDSGIAGISGLTKMTDDALSGKLNPRGVNVLRTFPGAGTVVWGARTLKGDDTQTSDFKYIPVRRMTDYIAGALYLGTGFAVFEPNDPTLWGQLRLAVGSFMRGLFRQGAFQQNAAATESDSFFVVCDETVNPQSEIDLGRVNVVVGFAPLKPAEFVIITITQISQTGG